MKAYGEVEVQLHHFWPRHYMEVSGQLHAPAALSQGKNLWYPLDTRLSLDADEKNLLSLPGIEPQPSNL
jgi:hypothetical protein